MPRTRPADNMVGMGIARRRGHRGRSGPGAVDEVIDLRLDETIDLRGSSAASQAEYRCLSVWGGVRPTRDRAADEWEQTASLIELPSDLGDRRADLRRDDLDPGHLSAVPLRPDEIDET
jgi:hypothetical protein